MPAASQHHSQKRLPISDSLQRHAFDFREKLADADVVKLNTIVSYQMDHSASDAVDLEELNGAMWTMIEV